MLRDHDFIPSPLRYVAIVITVAGVVLTFAVDDASLGTFVLAAGLLLSATDAFIRREPGIGALVTGLAVMLVASEENWTTIFYLSAVPIIAGAAWALRGALRPST